MLNIFWLHVNLYIFNVIQIFLGYIKCIGTPQEVTKLQIILRLNEYKDLLLDAKLKKLVNIERCTI
jgi:hypothetical protein